jgi:hypothetical protein
MKTSWDRILPRARVCLNPIYILYGCSVLIVLRKVASRDGMAYYMFIGECYVHDITDGKAFHLQKGEREFMEIRNVELEKEIIDDLVKTKCGMHRRTFDCAPSNLFVPSLRS